jgi:uncharacterized membrane protein YhaH (DUF805 family)
MFTLLSTIISVVLAILTSALSLHNVLSPGLLYLLAVVLPSLAVSVRRLHDTGRSGWWLLISIIPLIGTIVLIVLFATDGERQPNTYGPDPKAVAGEAAAFA